MTPHTTDANIEQAIHHLTRGSDDERYRASLTFGAMQRLQTPEVAALLAAASSPALDASATQSVFNVLHRRVRDEHVPLFAAAYDELASDDARARALGVLVELGSITAYAEVARLLSRPSSREVYAWTSFEPLRERARDLPRAASALFPGLIAALDVVSVRAPLLGVFLMCAEKKVFDFDAHPALRASLHARLAAILAAARAGGVADGPMLSEAAYLLDLARFFPLDEVEPLLRDALTLSWTRPRLFAALTLLARKRPVSPSVLEDIASTADGRALLWMTLEDRGLLAAFPARYRQQDALAEADMVHWLTYPTELGHPPTAIAIAAKVPRVRDGRKEVGYLFKFRDDDSFEGRWLVGAAGPYAVGEVALHRDAWSEFDAFDARTLEEHVRFHFPDDDDDLGI